MHTIEPVCRRRRRLTFGLAAAALAACTWAASAAAARDFPGSFGDLAERLSPAVVNISTSQKVATPEQGFEFQFPPGSPFEEFFKEFLERHRGKEGPRARRQVTSLGSGFVIEASGLVVTNNHVIADADEITVITHDGDKLAATLIGKDPKTDLALLKVEPVQPLHALKWGDSRNTRVGDWVLAIGNPFGLGGTVTAGIVSARGRDINAGPYDDFIQTDAAINPGNSGGPLFNLDGEVIGISTAIYSPTGGSVGIGFAVPSALAEPVIRQLMDFGRTRRGWLGVNIQTVTDEIAEGLGLKQATGALVARVNEGGPAAKAGVEQGDVILSFNDREVQEMRMLPRIVAETPVGEKVSVTVWRKGQVQAFEVTLGELEEAEARMASADEEAAPEEPAVQELLGMSLAALDDESRQAFDVKPDLEGVVVTAVTGDSPAAERGIRPGDVIVEVAQEAVRTPQQVADKVKQLQAEKRKHALLLVQRDNDLRFVPLRLDPG